MDKEAPFKENKPPKI